MQQHQVLPHCCITTLMLTGVSHQANTQALLCMSGLSADDIIMVEWQSNTFRPCHYVAVDHKRRCIVLAVRGSLEIGDIATDLTAAPLEYEFQGVKGWVHEGLMSAATYVQCNTVDALAEAAEKYPGWPLFVTGARGHSVCFVPVLRFTAHTLEHWFSSNRFGVNGMQVNLAAYHLIHH